MSIEETPKSVLKNKIEFYEDIIIKIEKRDGISIDVSQEKINAVIFEFKEKLKAFNTAYKILNITDFVINRLNKIKKMLKI